MRTKPSLDFADAKAACAASLEAAQAMGAKVTVAVVDDAGALICLTRMDGALAPSADFAHRKARTAAAIGVPTSVLEAMAREGKLTGIDVLAQGGGLPVKHEGQCAGAVGVAGTSAEGDEQIAAAGIAVLG
jgi:uncharacterized protein GlcG (DUF336 family)